MQAIITWLRLFCGISLLSTSLAVLLSAFLLIYSLKNFLTFRKLPRSKRAQELFEQTIFWLPKFIRQNRWSYVVCLILFFYGRLFSDLWQEHFIFYALTGLALYWLLWLVATNWSLKKKLANAEGAISGYLIYNLVNPDWPAIKTKIMRSFALGLAVSLFSLGLSVYLLFFILRR